MSVQLQALPATVDDLAALNATLTQQFSALLSAVSSIVDSLENENPRRGWEWLGAIARWVSNLPFSAFCVVVVLLGLIGFGLALPFGQKIRKHARSDIHGPIISATNFAWILKSMIANENGMNKMQFIIRDHTEYFEEDVDTGNWIKKGMRCACQKVCSAELKDFCIVCNRGQCRLAYKTELITWCQALEKASAQMVWTALHFVVAMIAMFTSNHALNTWRGVYLCIAWLAFVLEVMLIFILLPVVRLQTTAFYRLLAWEWLEEAGVYVRKRRDPRGLLIPAMGIKRDVWQGDRVKIYGIPDGSGSDVQTSILAAQKRKIIRAQKVLKEAIKSQGDLNKDYGYALTNAKVAVLAIAMLLALNPSDVVAIDIITAANIAAICASAGFAYSALREWQESAALYAKAGWLVERANHSYDDLDYRSYYKGLSKQPADWFIHIQKLYNENNKVQRGELVGRVWLCTDDAQTAAHEGRVYLLRNNRSVAMIDIGDKADTIRDCVTKLAGVRSENRLIGRDARAPSYSTYYGVEARNGISHTDEEKQAVPGVQSNASWKILERSELNGAEKPTPGAADSWSIVDYCLTAACGCVMCYYHIAVSFGAWVQEWEAWDNCSS